MMQSVSGARRVLLAWEIGEGFGHVTSLREIALALRERGFDCVFALREPAAARALIPRGLGPVLPAPRPRVAASAAAASYENILANYGFADAQAIMALAACWRDLFDLVQPELIVADYAPGAAVAARGRWPVIHIGAGFGLPPNEGEAFPLLPGVGERTQASGPLLAALNAVFDMLDAPPLERLPELFAGAGRAVLTLPGLDPYRTARREAVLGALEAPPPLRATPPDARLFAYLSAAYPGAQRVAGVLGGMRIPVIAHVRDDSSGLAELLRARGVEVMERPPPLPEILPEVSAVLSHGGSATTHAALAAGRPQVFLPDHLEGRLMAEAVSAMGLGQTLMRENLAELPAALWRAATDFQLRDRALEAGLAIAREPRPDPAEAIADLCEAALGGPA